MPTSSKSHHASHIDPEESVHEETQIESAITSSRYDPNQHEVKTLLSWHAPGRPFQKHSFEYFMNSFLILIAVEIILFLFHQELLMLVVFALVFLSFALATIPPRMFYYKISSEGVRVEDYFYIWEELYDFYFLRTHNEETLHITTKSFYPGELTLTLGEISVQHAKSALLPYLPYREYIKPTFVENAGDWLEKNFPLEKKKSK